MVNGRVQIVPLNVMIAPILLHQTKIGATMESGKRLW